MIIAEKMESRQLTAGENPSAIRVYIVDGSSDDLAVMAFANSYIDSIYNGLLLNSVEIEPIAIDAVVPDLTSLVMPTTS